jgi:hypothetical protein
MGKIKMTKNNDLQNTTQKTKDRATTKTRGEFRCSARVGRSCSTSGTRRVHKQSTLSMLRLLHKHKYTVHSFVSSVNSLHCFLLLISFIKLFVNDINVTMLFMNEFLIVFPVHSWNRNLTSFYSLAQVEINSMKHIFYHCDVICWCLMVNDWCFITTKLSIWTSCLM